MKALFTAAALVVATPALATQSVVDHPTILSAGPNCYRVSLADEVFALDYEAKGDLNGNSANGSNLPTTPQAILAIIGELKDAAANPKATITVLFNAPTQHLCDGVKPWQIISVN
jgi:hypothetical protein